jgi:lysozyme family protein
MSGFESCFQRTLHNEGGMQLHTITGDNGGRTFAGITHTWNPHWEGWQWIDQGSTDHPALTQMVRTFYYEHYWVPLKGDDNPHAATMFDFGVNAGVKRAIVLSQTILNVVADGILGEKTLHALRQCPRNLFIYQYTLAKVARYVAIVNTDRSQSKFLLGWLNRTLRSMA